MTSLEFRTIFDTLGITVKESRKPFGNCVWKVYWKDFIFSFHSAKYYTVVDGKIPMEVGNLIYSKYPGNPYKIRVEGGHEDFVPIDRGNGAFYLYHIDSKEGLLIFMTEMMDYLAKRNGEAELYVKQYPELLEMVSIHLIERLNPFILMDEWMKDAVKWCQETTDSAQLYRETLIKSEQFPIDQEIRNALQIFDKSVNPFLGEKIETVFCKEIISNASIRGNIFNHHNGMNRENCMVIELKKKDTHTSDYTKAIRDPDGFYFTLDSGYYTNDSFYVIHYFANSYSNAFDNGEVLVFEHEKDGEDILKIRYNLTLGLIQIHQQEPRAITKSQKRKVYQELLLAIKVASKITMSQKEDQKIKKRTKINEEKNCHKRNL